MNHTSLTIHATGEATGFIPAPESRGKPITVIGTDAIRQTFDQGCLQQALNSRGAPGVTDLVLNPDAHSGYGAPVGCVMVSPTHIYPGPVGVDIKPDTGANPHSLNPRAIMRSLHSYWTRIVRSHP